MSIIPKKSFSEEFISLPSLSPPKSQVGVLGWLRENLFSSILNSVVTVLSLSFVVFVLVKIMGWLILDADWVGESREDCSRVGACWVFIGEKMNQFLYGFYPKAYYWRPNLVVGLAILGIIPFFFKKFKYKKVWFFSYIVGLPIVGFFILYGGWGVPKVEILKWGGLMLTLLVAYIGVIAAFPIGVVLALGRSSELKVAKLTSVVFVEFWRGVPLITILFMSSSIFPLFFPEDVKVNKVLRALIGITLFQAAYIAEVVRGGLQAIPKGQYEAANSLGLSYWQKVFYIVLPQAIKIVIPSIVGASISLLKDTTLLLIIGLLDILAIVKAATQDTNWVGFELEGYVFAGILFWIICYSMSRYSIFLERKFSVDKNKKIKKVE